MNVLLAVIVVSVGSLTFRLAPLLAARRVPERWTDTAEWAGLAVITAIIVRALLSHHDDSTPAAPLVAASSLLVGLLLARRGHSIVLSIGAGTTTYLLLTAALHAVV